MFVIPIQPIPAQILTVVLDGQNCQISLYQKNPCMFADLTVGDSPVSQGVQVRDSIQLNPNDYEGFDGNLFVVDTQGNDDPVYTGLGSRFQLIYLTEVEYEQFLSK